MFKSAGKSGKIDTVIGKDTCLEGSMTAKGSVQIEGRFNGQLDVDGDLIIGRQGNVQADLRAKNLIIAGKLFGQIESPGKLELMATGRLEGDVKVGKMIIEEGGQFLGNCKMLEHATETPPPIKAVLPANN